MELNKNEFTYLTLALINLLHLYPHILPFLLTRSVSALVQSQSLHLCFGSPSSYLLKDFGPATISVLSSKHHLLYWIISTGI